MRSRLKNAGPSRTRLRQAAYTICFLERESHIVEMFEDVVNVYLEERFRCEWPRPAIEIVNGYQQPLHC